MAKEVPYFKFFISEWLNGDITLEEMHIQGVFINVCAYYWSKDCQLSITNLKKRFRGYDKEIDYLIQSSIIKIDNENVVIMFLNEQLNSKEIQKIVNRQNGSLGGRPKKITEEKPNGLFFDNRNETETITETKAKEKRNITNIDKIREYNISFSDFWNLYDKKVGDKSKAEKMWYKLKDQERELIMSYIPKYILSQPDKKFRLHPTSFLNQRGWESELIGIETNQITYRSFMSTN